MQAVKMGVNESEHQLPVSMATAGAEFRLLQGVWDLRVGYEAYLQSPLFPILMSVSFYFCCVSPFMFLDLYCTEWKWLQKRKIQPNKQVTWPLVRRAVLLTTWNHVLFILPVSVMQWVYTPPTPLPDLAPTLWQFVWHQFAALAVFDFEYWIWHSLHHKVRFLYRHCHAVHHHYSSPSSWVTQYLHPWELISVGFFTTSSPMLFGAHPFTTWSFMLLSIAISVEAHIGYDFPGLPHHWMPFWGGSIKHDMHHQKPLSNFEPFFNWWDRLVGWDCPGQLAGGVKSPALLDWEKRKRGARDLKKHMREQLEYAVDDPDKED